MPYLLFFSFDTMQFKLLTASLSKNSNKYQLSIWVPGVMVMVSQLLPACGTPRGSAGTKQLLRVMTSVQTCTNKMI
jgi:hypothetical protein